MLGLQRNFNSLPPKNFIFPPKICYKRDEILIHMAHAGSRHFPSNVSLWPPQTTRTESLMWVYGQTFESLLYDLWNGYSFCIFCECSRTETGHRFHDKSLQLCSDCVNLAFDLGSELEKAQLSGGRTSAQSTGICICDKLLSSSPVTCRVLRKLWFTVIARIAGKESVYS